MRWSVWLYLCFFCTTLFGQSRSIAVRVRGIYSADISIIGNDGLLYKNVLDKKSGVAGGTEILLRVPIDLTPASFLLRFDYKELPTSEAYPSELVILVADEDVRLAVNPLFTDDADSTLFSKGERENTLGKRFMKLNAVYAQRFGVLEKFLWDYTEVKSLAYHAVVDEYEHLVRKQHLFLDSFILQHRNSLVSRQASLQYKPLINWKGGTKERMQDILRYYFDKVDLKDTMLLSTGLMKGWIDGFVNLTLTLAGNEDERDSLLEGAAKEIVERGKKNHPKMYGWMVDYFWNGFEAAGLSQCVAVLLPYAMDANCPANKKHLIVEKAAAVKVLAPGNELPNVVLEEHSNGRTSNLTGLRTLTTYRLVLFWSADCEHCRQIVQELNNKLPSSVSVIAISIDNTPDEVVKWEELSFLVKKWKHIRLASKYRENVIRTFGIRSVPQLFLIEGSSEKIIAVPLDVDEVIEAARK